MRHTKRIVLAIWLVLLLFFGKLAQAQDYPTIYLPVETVKTGSDFNVDLKVLNYEQIVSTQFTVSWDPQVIQFNDVNNLVYDVDVEDAIGFGGVDTGILSMLWLDMSLTPLSLEDETTILSLSFTAVGDSGSKTDLAFINEPTVLEIADSSLEAVTASFEDGEIEITFDSKTKDLILPFDLANLNPNPLGPSGSLLEIMMPESAYTHLEIISPDGKKVHESVNWLNAGLQQIPISRDHFTSSGLYFINFSTTERAYRTKVFVH